jgi:hypothetical protein
MLELRSERRHRRKLGGELLELGPGGHHLAELECESLEIARDAQCLALGDTQLRGQLLPAIALPLRFDPARRQRGELTNRTGAPLPRLLDPAGSGSDTFAGLQELASHRVRIRHRTPQPGNFGDDGPASLAHHILRSAETLVSQHAG